MFKGYALQVKSGQLIPSVAYFSYQWEPVEPSNCTCTIKRRNLISGAVDYPVENEEADIAVDGAVSYDYTAESGTYEYVITCETTDTTVDQKKILVSCMSGGWADDLDTNTSLCVKLLRNPWRKVAPNTIELYNIDVDVTNITTEEPIESWELFDSDEEETLTNVYYMNRVS